MKKHINDLECPYIFAYDEVKSTENITVFIQDENGVEVSETYSLKELIEIAISLGYLDGAMDLEDDRCLIRWDEGDKVREKIAFYNDLVNGLTFGDDEMQVILYELFKANCDTFYKVNETKVYELKAKEDGRAKPGYVDAIYTGGPCKGLEELIVIKWLDNYNVYTSKIKAYQRAMLTAEVDAFMLKDEITKAIKEANKPLTVGEFFNQVKEKI